MLAMFSSSGSVFFEGASSASKRRPLSPKGRRMGRACIRPCLRDVYQHH